MGQRVAVIWKEQVLFSRLLEDCGHSCELITPHLLAAPFFRRTLHGLVIPAGFAAPGHTTILSALRAIRPRIRRFVQEGGTLLAFGAGADIPDAYDWLPVPIRYQYGFEQTLLEIGTDHPSTAIVEQITRDVSIDGILLCTSDENEGQVILQAPAGPVMMCMNYGSGRILVASLHEYPSHRFIREFCAGGGEGLL